MEDCSEVIVYYFHTVTMSTRLTSKDLKDIQNVLWDAQKKWFNIGIQLGLDSVKLEAIKCNCTDVEDRFTKMLSEWLVQVDPEPTWDRLVSALKARPVDCKQIAREIEQKYCTKEPIPHQSPPLTLAAGNVTIVKYSDIENELPTLADPPRKVMVTLEDLDDSFSRLVLRTYENLCKSGNFTVSFLRQRLNTFPSRRRFEHQEFLDNYILKMEHDTTADDLWSQLCSYWHFINYGLLKFIINKAECRELICDMNQYEIEWRAFSEETSIHDFVKCFPELYQRGMESANKSELNVKLGDKFKLRDLNRLEKAFVTTFSLPEICGLILKKISTGCFNITWMVPVHYAKLLRWKLSICDEEFFKKHDIESVSLDGEECYFKGSERTPINPAEEVASNMEIIHEEFELLNMMDKVVKSSPPFTVTQLCTAYTCKLLTHHLSNHPVYGEKQLQIHKFSDLPPEIHRKFIYLSRLAYEGFIREFHSHCLSFIPKDIDGVGLTTFENLGLHMFIHKTLQCYLAAVHISTTITDGISEYAEELSPYIKAAGYLPYFVAGLTKLTFIDEVFTVLKKNVSICLMSFEANHPGIANKNLSSSNVTALLEKHFIGLNMLYGSSEATSTGSHLSVDSGLAGSWHSGSASTGSHLSVDSGLVGSRHSSSASTGPHLSVYSGLAESRHSSRASTGSHLSVDSGLVGSRHSSSASTGPHLSVYSGLAGSRYSSSASTGSHLSVDSGLAGSWHSGSASTRSHLSVDSGLVGSRHSSRASTGSHLSVDSGLVGSRHSSSASTGPHLSVYSGLAGSWHSGSASTGSHLSVDSGLVGSRHSSSASTGPHLSVYSGLAGSWHSGSASTGSHLSVDSGLAGSRHSSSASTGSHFNVDSGLAGSRHSSSASTGSHFNVDSGLAGSRHSSSASTGSHLSVDSGQAGNRHSSSASTRSHLSVDSRLAGSRHSSSASTGSHLSVNSGQAGSRHSSRASTGSHFNVDSGLSMHFGIRNLIPQRHRKHIVQCPFSTYTVGWGMYFSNSSWKLFNNPFYDNEIKSLTRGLIAAVESVCKYQGLTLSQRKFKLSLELRSYDDLEWLTYMPYNILHRIDAVNFIRLLNLFQDHSSHFNPLFESLLSLREVKFESITDCELLNCFIVALRQNTPQVTNLTLLNCSINKGIYHELVKMLQGNTALKELDLFWNGIGGEGACELAKMLQANTALKELNLSENEIGDKGACELAKMLQANTALKELNLSSNGIGGEGACELAKMLQANTALKELNLSENEIGDKGACELAKMLQANTALKELNLSENEIGDKGACELAKMLQANTALKELNLSQNGIGDEGACELAKMLQANTALKELNLSRNEIGDEGACELAKMLQANTALKELNLSWNGIGNEGACELAKMLQANTALKELNLSWNGIGDEGACELAKMLQANTALKELNLSGNEIGDKGACELAKMLQANTALKELNLYWNEIGDKGACELAKMLQANTALKELNLSWNGIGNEGACELAKMLQANTALKELNLSWNGIGDEGACELAKMLQANTALKELNLSRNFIGDEGACELAKMLQANTALKELEHGNQRSRVASEKK